VRIKEEEMQREKALAKPCSCWSWCIIGAVLLVGLAAPVQMAGEATPVENMPPSLITSSGIKVSVVGNRVRIETPIPVVIDVKPLIEVPAVDLKPAKPGAKTRLSQREPIIIAPTP